MYAAPALPITSKFLNPPAKVIQQVPQQVTETVAPVITQRVSVLSTPSRTDLLTEAEKWSWAEFRDYVCAEITCFFGAFPRDSRKEHSIFSRYLNTFGNTDAIRIADYAFGPVCSGWWGNAPISINRFCKGSDPYFSIPILERLNEVSAG